MKASSRRWGVDSPRHTLSNSICVKWELSDCTRCETEEAAGVSVIERSKRLKNQLMEYWYLQTHHESDNDTNGDEDA